MIDLCSSLEYSLRFAAIFRNIFARLFRVYIYLKNSKKNILHFSKRPLIYKMTSYKKMCIVLCFQVNIPFYNNNNKRPDIIIINKKKREFAKLWTLLSRLTTELNWRNVKKRINTSTLLGNLKNYGTWKWLLYQSWLVLQVQWLKYC